jgi:hypothetical protein
LVISFFDVLTEKSIVSGVSTIAISFPNVSLRPSGLPKVWLTREQNGTGDNPCFGINQFLVNCLGSTFVKACQEDCQANGKT